MAAPATSTDLPENQQFGNVLLAGKDQHREENLGTLRMHAGGFGWKSRTTGNIIAVSKADLRGVDWAKCPPYACMLKLHVRGGFSHAFVGLRSQDKTMISEYVAKAFGVEMEDVPFSWKGWNWGEASVEGTALNFRVDDAPALQIPLAAVSQAVAANRKEAIVELADDDTAEPEDEMLVGIRFFVPTSQEEEDEQAEDQLTPAETLVAQIKENADLEVAGASLATFDDVGLTVPRGRYDVEMFDKFLKLHGKTYDYKVLYTNVSSIYALPKQDNYTIALVISLEHPLRQGATMYPHVIMQLAREATVSMNMPEAELRKRFEDKLEKSESGDLIDILPKVLCAFTKKKLTRPKASGFNGEKEDKFKSIRCSLKANEGFLYPLDKNFFFVSNKPLQLDFERIGSLEFNRVDKSAQAQAARTFDITLYLRDGTNHQFVNLPRSDYKELFSFLTNKGIKIRNLSEANKSAADEADDESEDEGADPYMDRIRRQRAAAQQAEGDDDDDDEEEESEDEDFAPGADSDVEEEYEEGPEKDEESAGIGKKKKAKETKAQTDEPAEGSESSDSDAPKLPKKSGKGKDKAAPPAKKARKKKDKDAPKRGLSGFMFFTNGNRQKFKDANPGAKVTDIGRIAGAAWKELDADGRVQWEDKARADKARYEREMAEFKATKRAAAAAASSSEVTAPRHKGRTQAARHRQHITGSTLQAARPAHVPPDPRTAEPRESSQEEADEEGGAAAMDTSDDE